MKSAAFVVLASFFLFLGPQIGKAPSKPSLSKKELKQLVATAKTAEDHLRIAAYYRDEAQKLEEKKNEHTEMGAEYDRNPQRYPTKPSPGQHCSFGACQDAAGPSEGCASLGDKTI